MRSRRQICRGCLSLKRGQRCSKTDKNTQEDKAANSALHDRTGLDAHLFRKAKEMINVGLKKESSSCNEWIRPAEVCRTRIDGIGGGDDTRMQVRMLGA